MRKSNWLVLVVAIVASALLLWVWFALGYSHVDSPLDMMLTALWWLVIAVVISAIVWAERHRRQKMLTAFVGNGIVYNPEKGVVRVRAGESEVELLRNVLAGLTFEDDVANLSGSRSTFRWIVRTRHFENNGAVWTGEVVPLRTASSPTRVFQNQAELAAILGQ